MTDPGFPSFQVGIMAMLVYPPVNHQSYGKFHGFSPIGNDLFFAWRVSTKLPKFQPKNITFRMNRQHPSIGIFAETWSMKALIQKTHEYDIGMEHPWVASIFANELPLFQAMNRPPMASKKNHHEFHWDTKFGKQFSKKSAICPICPRKSLGTPAPVGEDTMGPVCDS